ncbi:MAG: toll/interleukin-1 receptor domain-containing protein, partial [Bacteroidota bacterium]
MSTLFISHSSRDNTLAKDLEERLEQKDHHSVFLDLDPEKGIVAGQSWERTLYRKLRSCRAVVALCTDHYLKSHWCFAEIALARMEGKHIFALLVDPLSKETKLPSILTEEQYIDLRTNPEEGYNRLWHGLQEKDLLGLDGGWDP